MSETYHFNVTRLPLRHASKESRLLKWVNGPDPRNLTGRQDRPHEGGVSFDDEFVCGGRVADDGHVHGSLSRHSTSADVDLRIDRAGLGTLAMSILHDLRNPLATIHSGAEMLNGSQIPEKQVRRLASNMRERLGFGFRSCFRITSNYAGRSGAGASVPVYAPWLRTP